MFQLRAAPGAGLLAGLCAILLAAPGSAAPGKRVATVPTRTARATARTATASKPSRPAAPRPTPTAAPGQQTAKKANPLVVPLKPRDIKGMVIPPSAIRPGVRAVPHTNRFLPLPPKSKTAAPLRVFHMQSPLPGLRPLRADLAAPMARTGAKAGKLGTLKGPIKPGPKANSGNPDLDKDMTASFPGNEIEPSFQSNSYAFIFSADVAQDQYPNPQDSYEPAFLTGNDYRLLYADENLNLSIADVGERGEFFEGDVTASRAVAFSAFWGRDKETDNPYKSDPIDDGQGGTINFDVAGPAVRTIAYSANLLTHDAQTAPEIKILKPALYGVTTVPDPNDATKTLNMPLFTPDASPVWSTADSRYIYFVSLRGYKVDDQSTWYTSLWRWDTQADNQPAVELMAKMDGLSILNPHMSPDGKYIAFTAADVNFPPTDVSGAQVPPDISYDINVTKTKLAEIKQAWIYAGDINNPMSAVQVTTFATQDGKAPRDIMPFWSPLDQLGFSSDRLDTNDDGLTDAIPTDPAKATFSIWTFPFPFDPNDPESIETPDVPDALPHRRTLGPANGDQADESNELYGSWRPLDPGGASFSLIQPSMLYQSDNTGNWDIWYTDQGQGFEGVKQGYNGNVLVGLPKVTPKLGQPGDQVTIAVQVNPDYIKDTTKVYALVKDPDNKIFEKIDDVPVEGDVATDIYRELESYPVRFRGDDIKNYQDKYAGKENAPELGPVIQLQPDPSLGANWYSARWYTPMEVSDYLIDVNVVVDGEAWMTDNIGGFSTAPFVPYSRTLLVSDFSAGQKSVAYTSDTMTTAGVPTESYIMSYPHADFAWTPYSSPRDTLPLSWPFSMDGTWSILGPRLEWTSVEYGNQADPFSGRLPVTAGTLNMMNPEALTFSSFGNTYDLWRTQCREPITMDVLKNYLPYFINQPGYPNPKATRKQLIADRFVIWTAPHAGQLNGNAGANSADVGTIANISTQGELLKYINKGGRLMLAGDDVAFTLTQEGTIQNALLNQLHVQFGSHYPRDVIAGDYAWQRHTMKASQDSDMQGTNPIPYAVWQPHWLPDTAEATELELAPFFAPVPFSQGLFYHPVRRDSQNRPSNTDEDGAWTNLYVDSVGVMPGAMPVYTYDNPGPNTATGMDVAAVQYSDPLGATDNAAFRKSLFFAFSIEGINRHYSRKSSPDRFETDNRLGQVVHNAIDWFTTGALYGKVYVTNNVTTPKDVLVWVEDDWNNNLNGRICGTALTDASGNYRIEGLESDLYRVYAYKAGFAAQNPERQPIHSGLNSFNPLSNPPTVGSGDTRVNLLLIPVQPGTLTGVVKDAETGDPLAGVTVNIHDIANDPTSIQTTTTDATGAYAFHSVPAGLYIVAVPDTTIGDVNYAAFATSADSPISVKTDTDPTSTFGDTTYNVTLQRRTVPPEPGTLEVTVLDESTGTQVPATGATVTVLDSSTLATAPVLDGSPSPNPGTTNDSGVVSMLLKAGEYKVNVHFGTFKDQSKTLTVLPDSQTQGKTAVSFVFGGVVHLFPANQVLMVSSPYTYLAGNTMTGFDTLLGLPANTASKAIVAYDSAAQNFAFAPSFPADSFHPGVGYGFKLPQDGRLMETGADPTTTGANYYVVRANIGWNLIGNPFGAPVPFAKAAVPSGGRGVKLVLRDDTSATLHDIDPSDPVVQANLLTGDLLWGANSTDDWGNGVYGGAYNQLSGDHAVIQPWQSYWVKVAQPVLFYFPKPTTQTAPARTVMAETSAAAIARPLIPAVDVWGLNITAASGKLSDTGLGLGLRRGASIGVDAGLDIAKPAPLAGGFRLFTAFLQNNGQFNATDIRGLDNNPSWTFIVNTNLNAQNVTLTWSPIGKLPAGSSLTLVDMATGQRVNMGAADRYVYRTARNGEVRRFQVQLRTASNNRIR